MNKVDKSVELTEKFNRGKEYLKLTECSAFKEIEDDFFTELKEFEDDKRAVQFSDFFKVNVTVDGTEIPGSELLQGFRNRELILSVTGEFFNKIKSRILDGKDAEQEIRNIK